jgi:Chitobiase/beta-hexosaminidase C-terminal domain
MSAVFEVGGKIPGATSGFVFSTGGGGGGGGSVIAPTFSPSAGTYTTTQTVTITCSTPSSSIYYTTDGTTPTFPITGSTTIYSTPLTVSATETIKAIGVASGLTNSSVASATYTIGSTTFDFFMSQNGDDNNAGSLGSPWSVTAFNSKSTTYSGKKIGIIGDIGATLSGVIITGAAGQFSCTANTLSVGQYLMISGSFGGSGSIVGYVSGTIYYISATNGTTTFTLTTTGGSAASALVTTTGTPSGLTYLLNLPITHGTIGGVQTTLASIAEGGGGNNVQVLNVNGGTSSANTYVASCNSAGAYTPRWAILDLQNPTGGSAANAHFIGQQGGNGTSLPPNPGFFTVDGLTVRNFSFAGISAENSQQTGNLSNVIVENNDLYNGGGVTTSSNPGAVHWIGATGIVINNNKVHDLSCTNSTFGYNAFKCYGTTGISIAIVLTNNTTYNCASILTKDFNSDFANCSYNYLDHGNFGTSNDGDLGDGCIVGHTPAAGVTTNIHHNIMLFQIQFATQTNTNIIAGIGNVYQNTFYGTQNSPTVFSALFCKNETTGAAMQFQRNIVYAIGSSGYDHTSNGGVIWVDSGYAISGSTFNNNVYGSNLNGVVFSRAGEDQALSFATWKSTYSVDANSVQVSTSPFSGTPTAIVPSSFAVNSSAIIGGLTCGALDGSGAVGCNF